jgi:uncharacterized damage-inducible protein DinB
MKSDVISVLYGYHHWANERILEQAAALTPEEFRAPGSASFSSVRDTLVHTLWAQDNWLARWQGQDNLPRYDPEDFPDSATLRERWRTADQAVEEFVAAQDEAALEQVVHYRNSRGEPFSYPLWQLLLHQVNHATQHRSEVAAVLTSYGHSPDWMDLTVYLDELKLNGA